MCEVVWLTNWKIKFNSLNKEYFLYAYFTPGIWKLLRCLKSLEETNSQQPVNPRQLPVLNHPCGKTASSGKTPPNELNLILWLNILCKGVNTLILFKITED